MQELSQAYFEMNDLRSRGLVDRSWISLRARATTLEGTRWLPGVHETYLGVVGIIVASVRKQEALSISWTSATRDSRPGILKEYQRAGTVLDRSDSPIGEHAVLEQYRDADRAYEWHLNQDLVLALELAREGNSWVRPAEDFDEIARLVLDASGQPELLEIRAEHLRDYLCARGSGLLLATFQSRITGLREPPPFAWAGDCAQTRIENGRWEGRTSRITTPDSGVLGGKWAILNMSRRDPELENEVPVLKGLPQDEYVVMQSGDVTFPGTDAILVSGELWRNEWLEPSVMSPRVRGDKFVPNLQFIVHVNGERLSATDLSRETRWLWFKPHVVLDVLRRRGARLWWHTEYTCALSLPSTSTLHIGINSRGLLNVFASDIADLPEHVMRIWAAHNVTPDGPVSAELLAAEMHVAPAKTYAPEDALVKAMHRLDQAATSSFGSPLYSAHAAQDGILARVHRFTALEHNGVHVLCKEITRIVVDRLDYTMLKRVAPKSKQPLKLRSLKLLESILDSRGADGYSLMGPLHGVFELRHADAHLPPSDLSAARALLGLVELTDPLAAGHRIIRAVTTALESIASVLR